MDPILCALLLRALVGTVGSMLLVALAVAVTTLVLAALRFAAKIGLGLSRESASTLAALLVLGGLAGCVVLVAVVLSYFAARDVLQLAVDAKAAVRARQSTLFTAAVPLLDGALLHAKHAAAAWATRLSANSTASNGRRSPSTAARS